MTYNALIGVTGFVGSNLFKQGEFSSIYNSSNITEINNQSFDLIVCAGARAEKWKANREPETDLKNIENLISHLEQVSTREFILISTVDVYPDPQVVYEDTAIDYDQLSPYGKHRYLLEVFIREKFQNLTIIRLPGLIGAGLKKNFIFDMLHNPEALQLTHCDSMYQFYSLNSIWNDIQEVRKHDLELINFATPPLSVQKIVDECFGTQFQHKPSKPPVNYDVRTHYAWIFNHRTGYIWTEEEEIKAIREFIANERKK